MSIISIGFISASQLDHAQINSDKDISVKVNNPTVINGSLLINNKPAEYASIDVYINNKFDSVIQMDSQGHFKYSYTPKNAGDYNVDFRYVPAGVNSTCHVKVNNYTIVVPSNITVKPFETATINGTLLYNGVGVPNADVYLGHGTKKVTTDSQGHFSYTFNNQGISSGFFILRI
ncbi:MAG: hypothetical protein MJ209_00865 [archaeon]|nr:hypothetical protein [archaeon]